MVTQLRENERVVGRAAAPKSEHADIESAAGQSRWVVRPGTAKAVVEELDAAYRASATINGAFQLVRDVLNQTYELDCQVEYLMRQRERTGGTGADMLYARLLRKQELFDKAMENALENYGNHGTDVRRVTRYGYLEERGQMR